MKLRHKLASLALLFVIALTGNVALCAWCILEYYAVLAEQSMPLTRATSWSVSSVMDFDHSMITAILLLNTLLGCGIALLGLRIVRRWIMRPIVELGKATEQIAAGNLRHSVPPIGADEFGALGLAINHMTSEIVRMQSALLAQERQDVAGRALRCVVHNIRGPLTGVHWLAEALVARTDLSSASKNPLARVLESVDRILEWLKAYRHSVAGIAIKKTSTPVAEILNDADEWTDGYRLDVDAGDVERLHVDPMQFRAALEAMVASVSNQARPGDLLVLSFRHTDDRSKETECVVGIIPRPDDKPVDAAMECALSDTRKGTMTMVEGIIRLHGGRFVAARDAYGRLRLTASIPRE